KTSPFFVAGKIYVSAPEKGALTAETITNSVVDKDRIRIEFYLTRTDFVNIQDTLVKSPLIETHPTIFRVYSLEDLMARKFIALYNRMEGKDIYDLFYCLDLDFNRENLLKALKIMLDFNRGGAGVSG
ncbi:MAG: nucleotidyl transferase AbiEii/AbiGii toxin family protein, partial [Euryarchaeota archaeon]|nr:nucleotidyl transferase AbiEii/AbiGii toxin family protein [Euryarchaeota archaeon]